MCQRNLARMPRGCLDLYSPGLSLDLSPNLAGVTNSEHLHSPRFCANKLGLVLLLQSLLSALCKFEEQFGLGPAWGTYCALRVCAIRALVESRLGAAAGWPRIKFAIRAGSESRMGPILGHCHGMWRGGMSHDVGKRGTSGSGNSMAVRANHGSLLKVKLGVCPVWGWPNMPLLIKYRPLSVCAVLGQLVCAGRAVLGFVDLASGARGRGNYRDKRILPPLFL